MTEITMIAALSENNVIGNDGGIPWNIPEDMKHFRELTTGNTVIMGRKTYESLPEDYTPLPDRQNIVLSRSDPDIEAEVAESLEDAYRKSDNRIFIIGGESVYRQALEDADRLEITRVHRELEGDAFFPEIDDRWRKESEDLREGFSFLTYTR